MLQAPLNYVLIPAARLPRVLRGIHRGSVDAVSDTFRFLPFIFPPTQSPCAVAAERCWNLRFSQIQSGERQSSEALADAACRITYGKPWRQKLSRSCVFLSFVSHVLHTPGGCRNRHECSLWSTHEAHATFACAVIYYSFISAYELQNATKRGMSQELFIAGLVIENSPLPQWQYKTAAHLHRPGGSY